MLPSRPTVAVWNVRGWLIGLFRVQVEPLSPNVSAAASELPSACAPPSAATVPLGSVVSVKLKRGRFGCVLVPPGAFVCAQEPEPLACTALGVNSSQALASP